MLAEIDNDFYCSVDFTDADCMFAFNSFKGNGECRHECKNRHRKHPTPEEYKQEYDAEVPDDMAVYALLNGSWEATDFFTARENWFSKNIVIACTPFPRPDKDWRP